MLWCFNDVALLAERALTFSGEEAGRESRRERNFRARAGKLIPVDIRVASDSRPQKVISSFANKSAAFPLYVADSEATLPQPVSPEGKEGVLSTLLFHSTGPGRA